VRRPEGRQALADCTIISTKLYSPNPEVKEALKKSHHSEKIWKATVVVGNGPWFLSFEMAVQRRVKHLDGIVVRLAGPSCNGFCIDGMQLAVNLYIKI